MEDIQFPRAGCTARQHAQPPVHLSTRNALPLHDHSGALTERLQPRVIEILSCLHPRQCPGIPVEVKGATRREFSCKIGQLAVCYTERQGKLKELQSQEP